MEKAAKPMTETELDELREYIDDMEQHGVSGELLDYDGLRLLATIDVLQAEITELKKELVTKTAQELYELWQEAKPYLGSYFYKKFDHDAADAKYDQAEFAWLNHGSRTTVED